jgi:hypothetical protein
MRQECSSWILWFLEVQPNNHLEPGDILVHVNGEVVTQFLIFESLLYVLEWSGPYAFATAMISDSDTPEIIWKHKMRAEHLID